MNPNLTARGSSSRCGRIRLRVFSRTRSTAAITKRLAGNYSATTICSAANRRTAITCSSPRAALVLRPGDRHEKIQAGGDGRPRDHRLGSRRGDHGQAALGSGLLGLDARRGWSGTQRAGARVHEGRAPAPEPHLGGSHDERPSGRQPNTFRRPDQDDAVPETYACGRIAGGGIVTNLDTAGTSLPRIFSEASDVGTVAGTGLADWPAICAEFEPYYVHDERKMDVSGPCVESLFVAPT